MRQSEGTRSELCTWRACGQPRPDARAREDLTRSVLLHSGRRARRCACSPLTASLPPRPAPSSRPSASESPLSPRPPRSPLPRLSSAVLLCRVQKKVEDAALRVEGVGNPPTRVCSVRRQFRGWGAIIFACGKCCGCWLHGWTGRSGPHPWRHVLELHWRVLGPHKT